MLLGLVQMPKIARWLECYEYRMIGIVSWYEVFAQDPTDLLTGPANGYVAGQIIWDAFLVRPAFCCPLSCPKQGSFALHRRPFTD